LREVPSGIPELLWNNAPFDDDTIPYDTINGLQRLGYHVARKYQGGRLAVSATAPPYTIRPELRIGCNFRKMLVASSNTLVHIEVTGIPVNGKMPPGVTFSSVRTLLFTDTIYREELANMAFLISGMPHLQKLTIRMRRWNPAIEVFPQSDVLSDPETMKLPRVESLTLHNPSSTDMVLSMLPSSLRFLSFPIDPHPDTWTSNPASGQHRFHVNDGELPLLTSEAALSTFQNARLSELEELRLAIRDAISPDWLATLLNSLPKLKILELHHWPSRKADMHSLVS